jgi:hypothetical protein
MASVHSSCLTNGLAGRNDFAFTLCIPSLLTNGLAGRNAFTLCIPSHVNPMGLHDLALTLCIPSPLPAGLQGGMTWHEPCSFLLPYQRVCRNDMACPYPFIPSCLTSGLAGRNDLAFTLCIPYQRAREE